ncbi:MAG: hypothetical protein HYR73_06210, partial [Candidatus Eisenbacteria bacterium]|nr:hypothetical protein [Candidatus Eisenbacteria bacterium]
FGHLNVDRPTAEETERRTTFSQPTVRGIINGVMPYTHSGRTRYAVSIHSGHETVDSKYLAISTNAAGEFISLDSELQASPNLFAPENYSVRQLGAGFAVSQELGRALTASLGYDGIHDQIDGDTQDPRNGSQTHESRPYNIGQATLLGRIGPNFQWGADGRAWIATSEASWNFSLSAGQGGTPLAGRGKLLTRDEEGSAMRTRALWKAGVLDFGVVWNTDYQKLTITPPDADDPTSFNLFLNSLYYRKDTDTLALPDSVVNDVSQLHAWEVGGGIAWHVSKGHGLLGLEYHRAQQHAETQNGGDGPKRQLWDVRTGLSWRMTPAFQARTGYQYQSDDRDAFTKGNEYYGHLFTAGMGVGPPHSLWSFDLSYGIRWVRADYGDPTGPHGSRQQLASQIHWAF